MIMKKHYVKAKEFTRSDLKTGMYLELRGGNTRIVMLGTEDGDTTCEKDFNKCKSFDNYVRLYNYYSLSNWDKNLLEKNGFDNLDIMVVRGMYGDIIWERKEERPILTLDGVEYSESTLRSIIKKQLNNG